MEKEHWLDRVIREQAEEQGPSHSVKVIMMQAACELQETLSSEEMDEFEREISINRPGPYKG